MTMTQVLKYLLGLGAFGAVVALILVVVSTVDPERFDKWRALIVGWLSRIFGFFRKKYVQYDLQGRINTFVKQLKETAPYLADERVKLEWVDQATDRESLLREGGVILRLREKDDAERNFVHGAFMFVSRSLLFKTKRYISKTHRESIDLFVTTKLLEREKPSVVAMFLEDYLHPKTEAPDSKIVETFDSFDRLDKAGYFYPVFLQELSFLGDKVFGRRRDQKILKEVHGLVGFLDSLSQKPVGVDAEKGLDYCQDYCRFAVVIIGKPYNVASGETVWIRFILNKLMPKGVETLYLLGARANTDLIDAVAAGLKEHFEIWTSSQTKVQLRGSMGRMRRDRYLIVLRRIGAHVFHASEDDFSERREPAS